MPARRARSGPASRRRRVASTAPGRERRPRGAFGWLAPGALELAIAIRVAVVTRDDLRVHVGGGIVIDSDPAAELAETEVKAAGWRRALASLAAG